MTIDSGANVRLLGLKIVGLAGGLGVGCGTSSTVLALSQVSIDVNGLAVYSNSCVTTIDRSKFRVHTAGQPAIQSGGTMTITRSLIDGGDGVQALNFPAVTTIENSILLNQNGVDGALLGGVFSFGGTPPAPGSVFASFTTFVNSKLICGSGTPRCAGGSAVGSCVDSSIIIGATGDTISGAACSVNYSIVMPQEGAVSGSNNKLNVDPMFHDQAGGDYSLNSSSAAIDTANPNADVPAVDFAGTARPQGARADMGAFEYKP